jgi:hypothetical protein
MERKFLKFTMEIGDAPKDQMKKNDGMLFGVLAKLVFTSKQLIRYL